MTLYQISEDYLKLLQAIEDGEIPEEAIADTLESVESDIATKVDSIACYIKNLEADAAKIKAEEDTLFERRMQKLDKSDALKTYLSEMLHKVGMEKFESARNKISFRKSSSVQVENADQFIAWAEINAPELLKHSEPSISLSAIKSALKGGKTLVGASLVDKQNLQIK